MKSRNAEAEKACPFSPHRGEKKGPHMHNKTDNYSLFSSDLYWAAAHCTLWHSYCTVSVFMLFHFCTWKCCWFTDQSSWILKIHVFNNQHVFSRENQSWGNIFLWESCTYGHLGTEGVNGWGWNTCLNSAKNSVFLVWIMSMFTCTVLIIGWFSCGQTTVFTCLSEQAT